MSWGRKYLYRVIVDEAPAGIENPTGDGSRSVRHPHAEMVQVGFEASEERPSPLRIPDDLPAPVRDFQSLSPAMKLVDLYQLAGCKAHHERSNPITWPAATPADSTAPGAGA